MKRAITVQTIISEVGINHNKWQSEKHFTSWLGLIPSPVSNETNEKELFLPIIGELSKFITRPICFPNNEYWY